MSRKEKLLRKILEGGTENISFDDFMAAMQHSGFELKRITGSHRIMVHPKVSEAFPVQPAANGNAKGYQIRQFREIHKTL